MKWTKRGEIIFHKWKQELIFADKAISLITILLITAIRPDILVLGAYILLYPYLFLTKRPKAIYHLFVATGLAAIWQLIAHNQYGYDWAPLRIAGVSVHVFFSWAAGLFAIYLIYSHWEHVVKGKWYKEIILYSIIYWVLLIGVETLAFHIFGLADTATLGQAGLPLCDCIHGPAWFRAGYLLMGPIYISICKLIGLENPHHKNI
jgi:hypothetical protein